MNFYDPLIYATIFCVSFSFCLMTEVLMRIYSAFFKTAREPKSFFPLVAHWIFSIFLATGVMYYLITYTNYGLSSSTILFFIFNLLVQYAIARIRWEGTVKKEEKELSFSENWVATGMILSIVAMIFFCMIGSSAFCQWAESNYIQQLSQIEEHQDGYVYKTISIKSIYPIQRDGSTWFTIEPRYLQETVYEIKEDSDHNLLLSEWSEGKRSGRENLLKVKWPENEVVLETKSGNHVQTIAVDGAPTLLSQVVRVN